jgi:hypothetical protein
MNRVIIPSKYVGSTVLLDQFNFLSMLAVGETISTAVFTASVYSGVDASPSSVISGSATVATPTPTQKVTGGVAGVIYEILCTVTTNGGQTLLLAGYLAITPDLP